MDDTIDRLFTKEFNDVRDTVRTWGRETLTWPLVRSMQDAHRIPPQIIKKIGELEIIGFQIPGIYGGYSPFDDRCHRIPSVVVQEELAYFDPSVALLVEVSGGLFGHSVLYGGNNEQKKLLEGIVTTEEIGCFCLTEPGSGTFAGGAASTVKDSGGYYTLNGSKQFITLGNMATIAVWFAKSQEGESEKPGKLSGVLVRKNTEENPGFLDTVEDNCGVNASGTSSLSADNVLLPPYALLEGPYKDGKTYLHNGLSLAYKALDDGRLMIAADTLGMMKRCIDECMQYAGIRVVDAQGTTIAQKPNIQERIGIMIGLYQAARSYVYRVAWDADCCGIMDSQQAAAVKVFASNALFHVVDHAVQIFGGMGYSRDCPIEKLFRDSRVYRIFEGENSVLSMKVFTDERRGRV